MSRPTLTQMAAMCLLLTSNAQADLQGMEEKSLEWLVDSSDAIVVGSRVLKGHTLLHEGVQASTIHSPDAVRFLRKMRDGSVTFHAINLNTQWLLRVDDADQPWQRHLAVDKKGVIVSSRMDLIRRIDERVRRGASVPEDCDHEAVESGASVKGGFWISPPDTYQFGERAGEQNKLVTDVYLEILVPPDPEYLEEAERALTLPAGGGEPPFLYSHKLVPAILRDNYKTPEVATPPIIKNGD